MIRAECDTTQLFMRPRFWPLVTMRILPNALKIAKLGLEFCQVLNKLWKYGQIIKKMPKGQLSPNLVTLVVGFRHWNKGNSANQKNTETMRWWLIHIPDPTLAAQTWSHGKNIILLNWLQVVLKIKNFWRVYSRTYWLRISLEYNCWVV